MLDIPGFSGSGSPGHRIIGPDGGAIGPSPILNIAVAENLRVLYIAGDVILRRQNGHVLSHYYGHANFHAEADGVITQF